MRIASLLPSATEIVCALGLEEQLVAVSHECDYPASIAALPKATRSLIPVGIGSGEIDEVVRERLAAGEALYELDLPTLQRSEPDLIVTQALCDVCAVAEEEVRRAACALPGTPHVLNLEPQRLSDVLADIRRVAEAAGVPERADALIAGLEARIAAVAQRSQRLARWPRVVLLEWIDPLFSSGHWSPELVELAGGIEGVGRAGRPSEAVPWERIVAWQPDVMVIACCGFDLERTLADVPILESRPGWDELPCVRRGRVYAVDGSSYFSRPGPRLVDSLEILAHALDPGLHPLPPGLPAARAVA